MINPHLILASASETRCKILQNAGLNVEKQPARIDEEMIKSSMDDAGATARDIADALAEAKARKISLKIPNSLVLGSDQVLEFEGKLLSKAESGSDLQSQLIALSGKVHRLYSAAVFYQNGEPQARFIARTEMQMRALSTEFVHSYVTENWPVVKHSVGGYHFEGKGAQLFSEYRGDYFSILGLPLLFVLDFLRQRGVLET